MFLQCQHNKQLPVEIKTTISSSGYNSSHLGRDSSSSSLPTIDGAQIKVEGGTIGGTFNLSQLQASSPANHLLVNAPLGSVHQPSASSTNFGQDSTTTNSNSVKVCAANGISMFNMTSQAASDQIISMNLGQALSSYNPHVEIARTVQKLLQPNHLEHPSWAPPSRDYMNMALTCQICKAATNEVSTVLVCDACDKGYHIKCINLVNQAGVPRGEWHCQKCLIYSNGKPLPRKYGRVTRSMNTPKVPSSTASAQVSREKKVGAANSNVDQQKTKANGNPAIQRLTDSSAAGMNLVESASDSKVLSASGGQLNNLSDKSGESSTVYCDPAVGSSVARSIQRSQNFHLPTNERVSHSVTKSEPLANPLSPASSNEESVDQIQIQNCAEESSERNLGSNMTNIHRDGCYSTENIVSIKRSDVRRDDQVTNAAGSGPNDHSGLSTDGLQAVDWVGDAVQVVDGKKVYQSCCISGVIYKVHNYALFRFSPDKSTPSKLQAMWEDTKTGSKWLVVRKCYFPGDLPEIVDRPYTYGSNEVFESNQDSIVTPSLLQGQCEVLRAAKFEEEFKRRNQLADNFNSGLKPIFLCKWFYDEVKGTFQPSSSLVMHIN